MTSAREELERTFLERYVCSECGRAFKKNETWEHLCLNEKPYEPGSRGAAFQIGVSIGKAHNRMRERRLVAAMCRAIAPCPDWKYTPNFRWADRQLRRRIIAVYKEWSE